ncbi:MAG: hypothetical protein ACERKO_05295, partial [Acetanaerobacterium sp.]
MRRIICLPIVVWLLSVSVFAASFTEDFLYADQRDYLSFLNLQPFQDDINNRLAIGAAPDESILVLNNPTGDGEVLFCVSGAQHVRVAFYSKLGIYAEYLSETDTYKLSNTYINGRSKRILFDSDNRTLFVSDEEKLYYLTYDWVQYEYCFVPLGGQISAPAQPVHAWVNIYASSDNKTYKRLNAGVVRLLSGTQLGADPSVSSAAYCEVEADVPDGCRYLKVELNQPAKWIEDAGAGRFVPFEEQGESYLANATIWGDHFSLHSMVTADAPAAEEGGSETVWRTREDAGSSSAPYSEPAVIGDSDGLGRAVPAVPRDGQSQSASRSQGDDAPVAQ